MKKAALTWNNVSEERAEAHPPVWEALRLAAKRGLLTVCLSYRRNHTNGAAVIVVRNCAET